MVASDHRARICSIVKVARVIPGIGGKSDKAMIMKNSINIIFGEDSHCGDVRQPSLLESGGLSGRHMLSELKDHKDKNRDSGGD